jgi:hypothetical protein
MLQRAVMLALAGFATLMSEQPKLDQILVKHFEARGGLAKIKSIKSMRQTGRMEINSPNGTLRFDLKVESKQPTSFRVDLTINEGAARGERLISAYDGKMGWNLSTLGDNPKSIPMSPDELAESEDRSDIHGPLVDHISKGHQIEYAGKESLDGLDSYKLKIKLKTGNLLFCYLDTDTFLETLVIYKRTVNGKQAESEYRFSNYKKVDGTALPFTIEQLAKGSSQKTIIVLDKIELNIPFDETRLKAPR